MAGAPLPLGHAHTHTGLLPPSPLGCTPKHDMAQKSFPRLGEELCWLHTSLTVCSLCYQSLGVVFFWLFAFWFWFIFFPFGGYFICEFGFSCFSFFFFPSPNLYEIDFGENPFGCSSCPCISSHSQTCSLPSDISKNKWPTHRNTWCTPDTLQQHKLGKKSQSLHGKSSPCGRCWGAGLALEAGKSVAAQFARVEITATSAASLLAGLEVLSSSCS